MANFVNNQSNFGGFADLDEWFIERDINVIRDKASEWKNAQLKIREEIMFSNIMFVGQKYTDYLILILCNFA